MQLTLVSFICDTWTLAPLKPLRELDMGPSPCSPMGGDTTQAPIWPPLILCNTSVCSQLLGREVKREGMSQGGKGKGSKRREWW